MQCQCGYELPNPLPRFCPQCGTATATLPPAAPPPPPQWQPAAGQAPQWQPAAPQWPAPDATNGQAGPLAPARSLYVTAGLIALGALLGGTGGGLMTLLSLLTVALLVLDRVRPSWYPRLPAWLIGPRLNTVAAAVFVVGAVGTGLSLGSFLFLPGLFLFFKGAGQQGEMAPFDAKLLVSGWRLVMVVGLLLASFTFAASWSPTYHVAGYGGVERGFDGADYWVTHSGFSMGGDNNARSVGAATIPTLLMLAAVLCIGYRGKGNLPSWFRWIPLALGALMFLSILKYFGVGSWVADNPLASADAADGPYWFTFSLIPYTVGALMMGLGKGLRRSA